MWRDDILDAIEHRDLLFNHSMKDHNDSAARVLYQKACHNVTHMICTAKKEFYKEVLHGNDNGPNRKSTIRTTTSVGPKPRKNRDITMNASEIADNFKGHFCNIGTKYQPNQNTPFPDYNKLWEFTDYVFKQIKIMSNNKATGLNGITIKLLKVCADTLSPNGNITYVVI